ncbi:MAG: diacylglycerol kinase, partial [Burkholderiales bacterium]
MDSGTLDKPHKGRTGLRRVWNALLYSIAGLHAAFKHEHAFRQEVLLAALLIPAALFMPVTGTGKALMIAAVLAVLVVEC